jgi:hypothetical protein
MALNRRSLLPILAALALAACGGEPEQIETFRSGPAAVPADASSRDFGDYVNVSIVRKTEGGLGESVPGSVSASATNLTGQMKNLQLSEVKSGGAVYYIGDVAVAEGETLVFTVDATPMNESSRFSVRFTRQFYGK